jgi:glycosyltransferase involved in cell wall biosynthesis
MVFEAIINILRRHADVVIFDISPGLSARGLTYHIKRATKVARAVLGLFASRRRSDTLYHNVDAGMGMIYSLAIIATARLLNYRSFLHHHTYGYINQHNPLLDLVTRVGGQCATHVLLTKGMATAFEAQYPHAEQSVVLGNAAFLAPQTVQRIPARKPLVLGHLSRLGPDKGLPDVLRAYDVLAESDDAHLVLAGPADNDEMRHAIEEIIARHPSRVRWLGPVSGELKAEFFESIDVFLFPSRNEAQPLVILEALQAGRPSIAFARGTIGEMLMDSGSILIDPSEEFAARAIPQLALWSADRDSLISAGELSRERFANLLREAGQEIERLVCVLTKSQASSAGAVQY